MLGRIATQLSKHIASMRSLLKLKNRPRFHLVSSSLSIEPMLQAGGLFVEVIVDSPALN